MATPALFTQAARTVKDSVGIARVSATSFEPSARVTDALEFSHVAIRLHRSQHTSEVDAICDATENIRSQGWTSADYYTAQVVTWT